MKLWNELDQHWAIDFPPISVEDSVLPYKNVQLGSLTFCLMQLQNLVNVLRSCIGGPQAFNLFLSDHTNIKMSLKVIFLGFQLQLYLESVHSPRSHKLQNCLLLHKTIRQIWVKVMFYSHQKTTKISQTKIQEKGEPVRGELIS